MHTFVLTVFLSLVSTNIITCNFHRNHPTTYNSTTHKSHRVPIYFRHPVRQARQNLGIRPLLSDPDNPPDTIGFPLWFDETLTDFILRFIVPFSTPIVPGKSVTGSCNLVTYFAQDPSSWACRRST